MRRAALLLYGAPRCGPPPPQARRAARTALLLSAVLSGLFMARCGPGVLEGDPTSGPCTRDLDCAYEGFCVHGKCVTDPDPCKMNADCLGGAVCLYGNCGAACDKVRCPTGKVCSTETFLCVAAPDAGSTDAGASTDAGPAIADAGTPDSHDAGSSDAGAVDAGPRDAGSPPCTTDTWTNYASTTFSRNCASCHSFVSSYSGVTKRKNTILGRLQDGSMPPSGMSSGDRTRLEKWITCGAAQ